MREDDILHKISSLKYEIQQCYANPFQNLENFNFSYEIKMAYTCMLSLLYAAIFISDRTRWNGFKLRTGEV